jgi:hypothetical protein
MKLKPQVKAKSEQVTVRFPADVHAQIEAYTELLGGETDRNYVIVEAVRLFLDGDREFQQALSSRGNTGGSRRATVRKTEDDRA